jgi:diacylglycerol O-acyltransferase / wax synthase
MSNVLDLLDQTMFDVGQATGTNTRLQCVWVYSRAIDVDGLRQFRDHVARGRLSRRIERSPLPFGRHRWVAPVGSSDIEIVTSARPREEFEGWLDEQANTTLDCEHGPEWHLATIPFTDGGAGVSLVVSHCLVDGVGLWEAVAAAALGRDDPIVWPAAASRRGWQALREDVRQTVRDIPTVRQAVATAMRSDRRSREDAGAAAPIQTKLPELPPGADESVSLPATTTIFVNADEWDARAQSLGGTSNTLLVGLAARLAQRAGRVAADGSVVVTLPVDERTEGDTRANAITGIRVTVDPTHATTDLSEIRAAVKRALIHHGEVPDPENMLNALVPLMSKRLLKAARSATMKREAASSNLVGSSNVGLIDAAASRPDGTDADSFALRLHHLGATKARVLSYGGLQTLLAGTARGQVFVSLVSCVPGQLNSNDSARQELSAALNDFSLTGTQL